MSNKSKSNNTNNITAGQLEASRTKKQKDISSKLDLCNTELENLLEKINKSNNIHLNSCKEKLNQWKKNKKEYEIINTINSLIDYLNCQLEKIDKKSLTHTAIKNKINVAKKQLIKELKKIKI
tara:strand:+ start:367 stop:735 length:369 start_codon:yes stop_codon:yes gene_type:complete